MNAKLIIGLVIAGIIIIFTLQNAEVVEIRLFFWKTAMSRALMIFIVLAIGIVLGWLFRSLTYKKEDIID